MKMAGSIRNKRRIPEFLIYPHPSNSSKMYHDTNCGCAQSVVPNTYAQNRNIKVVRAEPYAGLHEE
jgi:hypothetical protein